MRARSVQEIAARTVQRLHVRLASTRGRGGGQHRRGLSEPQRVAMLIIPHGGGRGTDVRVASGEFLSSIGLSLVAHCVWQKLDESLYFSK